MYLVIAYEDIPDHDYYRFSHVIGIFRSKTEAYRQAYIDFDYNGEKFGHKLFQMKSNEVLPGNQNTGTWITGPYVKQISNSL
jgi:hypothetical protein